MSSIRNEILVEKTPEEVWDAVRDFGALHERLAPGFIAKCRLEGRDRIVTFANGSEARETLVDSDDATRRLAYAIVGGRFALYNASVQVFAEGSRHARLLWIIDMLPDDGLEFVRAAAGRAVQAMKQKLGENAATR